MKIRICLRYAREPELVALRFNPGIYMPGLAKQALQAQFAGQEFKIRMQRDVNYVQRSLSFYLVLNEETDKEIIQCLHNQCAPAAAFIRNTLIRCVTGNTNFIYSDPELKKLALNQPRAIVAQSNQRHKKNIESEEDVLLTAALELKGSLNKKHEQIEL